MARRRRTNDHYARRAKKEHYPARSIYKLEEIDRRVRLIKKGDKVVDLGAAPGSWTTYLATKVGPRGVVAAIDLQPLTIDEQPNVIQLTADVLTLTSAELHAATGREIFDVVVSDMAPHTSGHRFVDQSRSFDLFMRAVALAGELCRPGGHFVGKIFQGEDFELARQGVRELFDKVRVIRPASVRQESYEIYLVGLGKKAGRTV